MSTAAPSKQKDHNLALGVVLALVSRLCHESTFTRGEFVLVDRVDLMNLATSHLEYLAAVRLANAIHILHSSRRIIAKRLKGGSTRGRPATRYEFNLEGVE